MQPQLTDRDVTLIRESLDLLARAGVTLADQIEPHDVEDAVEDAVADDAALFRAFPLTTIAGLVDPDGAPLVGGAVVARASTSPIRGEADIAALVRRYAGATGAQARDVAVVPDPESAGETGSVRVRFGEWDVADIDYDFSGADGHGFELDVLAAALPLDAAAATFPTPDGRDVTLFIPAGADPAAVDALFDAIEAECGAAFGAGFEA
ncbi:hypothetical protein [Corynebacterium bouchesdurhonense]|uniref:hypothetical protein n=1 Tax=Corynebacterium bouchesdurhonense TaxID=1720192 RepID=UPI00082C7199|nr:hypothetical protein [Corynebacterium bouchesdurhonense]